MNKDMIAVEETNVVEDMVVEEQGPKRSKLTYQQKRKIEGTLYIIPWLIGFGIFFAYPMAINIYYSFNRVTYNARTGYSYTWVGFENFRRILRVEPDLIVAFQDFIIQIFTYVPVIIALSIIIALLLNNKLRGRAFFRLIFFLPIIILNEQLLSNLTTYGGMNFEVGGLVLNVINRFSPEFLLEAIDLLFGTVLQVLWYCGVPILIFLATIQKIDKSLYEAAAIDGASGWNIFWKITLPTIYPLVGVVIVYLVVFMANLHTGAGSITFIIRESRYNPLRSHGYAAAQAVLFAILQLFLVAFLFFITNARRILKGDRK